MEKENHRDALPPLENPTKKKLIIKYSIIGVFALLLIIASSVTVMALNQAKKKEQTVKEVIEDRIQKLEDLNIFPTSKEEEPEPLTTTNVGQVTVTSGDNIPWPTEIPTFIPKFATAQISSVLYSAGIWSVNYDGISRDGLNAYRESLIKAGFQTDTIIETNGDVSFNSTKNGYTVTPILTLEDSSLVICIGK